MNAQHSMATPVLCWISAIGLMSPIIVRAAQFAEIFRRASPIARASRSTSLATFGPAPGSPMSAVSMPSAAMWCRIPIFSSMLGWRTDGDCSPSRSVSSSSIATRFAPAASSFQSKISGWGAMRNGSPFAEGRLGRPRRERDGDETC